MAHADFSGAMLDWTSASQTSKDEYITPNLNATVRLAGPKRALGSHIPQDVYLEIFVWLRPAADPDTDVDFYNATLARLALVCRYFAHYATHEMWRCLNIDVNFYRKFRMRAKAWCKGDQKWLEPVETLQTRECTLRGWVRLTRFDCVADILMIWRQTRPTNFTTHFITMLSRFDNLAILTLDVVIITRRLLQCIGRLRRLEEVTILSISVDEGRPPMPRMHEPVFGLQETPFPALRRFTLHEIGYAVDNVLEDALRIFAGAQSLRTIVVEDSMWLNRLLSFINPQLVSFCGDLTVVPPAAFHRFIKGHAALQNLTVFFSDFALRRSSYLDTDLDPADLPDLRSFGGPFNLAIRVIGNRPVVKLASPRHMLLDSEPVTLLPFMREWIVSHIYTSFDSWDLVLGYPEVWRGLKPIGGGISQLFVCISDAGETILSQIGLCFPNLIHLELETQVSLVCSRQYMKRNDLPHELSWNIRKALQHFKALKSLALHVRDDPHAAYWISPGEQHNYVHDMYRGSCPTLKSVRFGPPMMVWHLHAVPMEARECHCELELLSPRMICGELRRQKMAVRVCDWQGKLARLLREESPRLSELEIGKIFTPP
jgi:F-box-like